jgi:methyl-accepting chemotaxis protein
MLRFGISAKLSLLSLIFAVPTAYLLWLLIAQQQIALDFAGPEVDGARALGALIPVQTEASRATLARQPATSAAGMLRNAQPKIAASLEPQAAVDAALQAFGQASDSDSTVAARGKLRDLITQIGDRSNLILDNVLETYYLTDVVLNRMPEVMDRVADLAASDVAADGKPTGSFLIAVGALSGAIDGMDASLAAAEQDNADGTIKAALHAAYQPLRGKLGLFLADTSSGGNGSAMAGGLTNDLAQFDNRAVAELSRLLQDRVAMLSWSRRVHVAISSLLYVVSLLLVLWIMHRSVSRPVARLVSATTLLAAGDLTVAVPAVQSRDEVGALAVALAVFKDSMVETTRLTAERDALRQQADAEKHQAMVGMAETIEVESATVMARVGARSAALAATAEEMSESALRAGESARAATTAATQALANAETVASAAEELAASIREISVQVGQSSTIARRAVAAGSATRTTIESLNEEVGRIGAVADMISEIAARTNLLALNATIEAARAGDAGKGFAVVASEVKQLATQTARSTGEIGRHIQAVRTATGASVVAVGQIEQTIGEISVIADAIAAAVEQQGAATAEIARNVTGTADAANEMTRRIQQVSVEAERTGERSGSVRDGTAAVSAMIGELRTAVIRAVRTSTDAVDRRRHPRHTVDRAARLFFGSQAAHEVRAISLSAGGAALTGGPAVAVGTRGSLEVDGIDMRVPCVVRAVDDHVTRVAFTLDAAGTDQFARALAASRLPLAA